MSGPSKQQTQTYDEQNAFYQQLNQEYSQVFGQQQSVLKQLQANLQPIINAGPTQQAFSKQQIASLNTMAQDQVATNYQHAIQGVQNQFSNQSGAFVPSGVEQNLAGQVASSAAQQLSTEQNQILQNGFQLGNQDYESAVGALSGVANMYNPNGTAGAANNAGSEVGSTANEITNSNNSWMNLVGGVLGGVGGAAVGKIKF